MSRLRLAMKEMRLRTERTVDMLQKHTVRVMKVDLGLNPKPFTIYSFDAAKPPVRNRDYCAIGSDEDIGGYSTSQLTEVPNTIPRTLPSSLPPPENSPNPTTIGENAEAGPSQSHIALHGNMSLRVPQEFAGRIRAGYAGMRNRKRITLIGEDTWDLGLYSHLKVTLAYRGWEGWRNKWYCIVQTDGPIITDVWQHRLELPASPGSTLSTEPLDPLQGPPPQFVSLHLRLSSFVLTNCGETSEKQIEMMRQKIRTIGFSLLGGGRGEEELPTPANQFTQAQITEMRRKAGAGFGKGGGHEAPDPVVEEMLRNDGIVIEGNKARSIRATGYHQVQPTRNDTVETDDTEVPEALRTKDEGSVKVTPWSEGYYELCVKSIEAVNYDPMAEDEAESVEA